MITFGRFFAASNFVRRATGHIVKRSSSMSTKVPVELLYWVVEDLVGTGEENGGATFSDLDVTHPGSISKDLELVGQGSVSAAITQQEQEHSRLKRACGLTTPPCIFNALLKLYLAITLAVMEGQDSGLN